ncbi:hypothetical protein O181_053129 [Austropuccinia psidii MF-1]|uniref:Uncharacterized protein n=1 Tax=Austropuccinia psidii MF-1 TaxID=1389203 RepID=A0A9Q3HSC9_9BASI|nr:hypothetical protein [Austropuccinia psidii MF-1]
MAIDIGIFKQSGVPSPQSRACHQNASINLILNHGSAKEIGILSTFHSQDFLQNARQIAKSEQIVKYSAQDYNWRFPNLERIAL